MKRMIGSLAIASILLTACATSQGGSQKTTVSTVNSLTKSVKGTWVVEDVTYNKPKGEYKVTDALGEGGTPECFINSTWDLNNTGGKGTYNLAGGDNCNAGVKNIVWSALPENGKDIFRYKVLNPNDKAKNVLTGYLFEIVDVTADQMTLKSNYLLGDSDQFEILYHFRKVQTKK